MTESGRRTALWTIAALLISLGPTAVLAQGSSSCPTLQLQWAPLVSRDDAHVRPPRIAWNGTHYGVAWAEGGDCEPRFRLIGEDGVPLDLELELGHRQTCTAGMTLPRLEWTGSEFGLFHEWANLNRFFLDRIDAAGNLIGSVEIFPGYIGAVEWTGSEYAVLYLEADTFRLLRLTEQGSPIGAAVDLGYGGSQPELVWNGNGFGLIYMDTAYDVRFLELGPTGQALSPPDLIAPGVERTVPQIAWNGSEYGVTWDDGPGGFNTQNDKIRFVRVALNGTLQGPLTLVSDAVASCGPAPCFAQRPRIVWSGDQWAITWYEDRSGFNDVFLARLDPAGAVVDEKFVIVADYADAERPELVWNGADFAVVCERQEYSCASQPCTLVGDTEIVLRRLLCCGQDQDGDGVGDCSDCDPSDPAVYQGAAELCDGLDNDCESATPDGSGEPWIGESCDGADTDLCEEGVRECVAGLASCFVAFPDDDPEVCDGVDNDCDGAVDEGLDADGDGYSACLEPRDCDDSDPGVGACDLVQPVPIPQFGRDSATRVVGGCEPGPTGPDRYMDSGEKISLEVSFQPVVTLSNLTVSIAAVEIDGDSPADCLPSTPGLCPDPERANNPPSPHVAAGSPVFLASAASGVAHSVQLSLQVAGGIAGTPEIELLVRFQSSSAPDSLLVFRQTLNVDEESLLYSTDYPSGGIEQRDYNGNGVLEDPILDPANPALHGRYETLWWSDLSQGFDELGAFTPVNFDLGAPWSFDVGDGRFTSGIGDVTTLGAISETIALWGEDLNFNNQLDGYCLSDPETACDRFPLDPTNCGGGGIYDCVGTEDRDPADVIPWLDRNHSTAGGCGWQTRAPATCSDDPTRPCRSDGDCDFPAGCYGPAPAGGGAWHTGRVGTLGDGPCLMDGDAVGQCQSYETISGTSGNRRWLELLLTPVVEKVNRQLDGAGDPVFEVEILSFGWNMGLDLADRFATFSWELDTDVYGTGDADLIADDVFLGSLSGPLGAYSRGNPAPAGGAYPMFAGLDAAGQSVNVNRVGDNACFFEGQNVSIPPYGLVGPPDGSPFAADNGPLRNMDVSRAGGPDLNFETLEDRIGDSGTAFRGAFGFMVRESDTPGTPAFSSFGATIDDVVLEWREFRLVEDTATCAPGKANMLQADRDAGTGDVTATWETGCGSASHNIVYGALDAVDSYGYSGRECFVGAGGPYAFNPGPGSYFFLVVANDGASIEGSYGLDSNGNPRPADSGNQQCPMVRIEDAQCD